MAPRPATQMGIVASMLRIGEADEAALRSIYIRRGIIKCLVGLFSATGTISLLADAGAPDDPTAVASCLDHIQFAGGTPAAIPLQVASTVLCLAAGFALIFTGQQIPSGGGGGTASFASCLLMLRLLALGGAQGVIAAACGLDYLSGQLGFSYAVQDLIALLYAFMGVKGRARLQELQRQGGAVATTALLDTPPVMVVHGYPVGSE